MSRGRCGVSEHTLNNRGTPLGRGSVHARSPGWRFLRTLQGRLLRRPFAQDENIS